MTQSASEKRKRAREIRQKKRRNLNRILTLIFVIALIIAAIAVAVNIWGNHTYKDEKEFEEYAAEYLSDNEQEQAVGQLNETIEYGQPLSVALTYPVTSQQTADDRIDAAVADIQNKFKRKNAGASKEEKKALILGYESHKTEREAVSVTLHKTEQEEKDKEMQTVNTAAYAYNFSTKTGRVLSAVQIFENDYKDFCSRYMTDYFEDKYKDELVQDKYKKALANSEENFNNFALSEDGVIFYFGEGTVVSAEEGSVAVEIPYKELGGVIRDEISERALDPNKPMVALTYDDGPFPQSSNRILDCLEQNGAVATFFELGQNAAAYPKVLQREKELGMEIGSHSWSHPNLNTLSDSAIKEQVDKTNNAIKSATGQTASVFRPPYGNSNASVVKHANIPVVLWSVDTLDWKSRNAASVEAVVKGVKKLDGKVILMHSIYDSTAEATENLVPWLLNQGYQLVTVSELLEYKYNETPKGKLYGYNYFYLND